MSWPYWEKQLQCARRHVLVGSRRRWVADGGAVFLGNATVGSGLCEVEERRDFNWKALGK